MHKELKIWLDDCRPAPEGWVSCRWPEEVIEYFKTGRVAEVSLDHDLGDCSYPDRTGYDVLIWIEKQVSNLTLNWLPEIHIHSSNPPASIRMHFAVKSIKILWERNQKRLNFKKSLGNEVLYCKICKRGHFRQDTAGYVYHKSIGVICIHHYGVKEWYEELIAKSNKELKESGVYID